MKNIFDFYFYLCFLSRPPPELGAAAGVEPKSNAPAWGRGGDVCGGDGLGDDSDTPSVECYRNDTVSVGAILMFRCQIS